MGEYNFLVEEYEVPVQTWGLWLFIFHWLFIFNKGKGLINNLDSFLFTSKVLSLEILKYYPEEICWKQICFTKYICIKKSDRYQIWFAARALICCRINTVTDKIVNKSSSGQSLPTGTWQTWNQGRSGSNQLRVAG